MADIGAALCAAQRLLATLKSSLIKEACLFPDYRSRLENLKSTVATIENVLRDAGNKDILTSSDLDLIDRLKDVIFDADDIFDEFLTKAERKSNVDFSDKVSDFFSSQNSFKVAYSMYREVKKITTRLDAIVAEFDTSPFWMRYETRLLRRSEETASSVYDDDHFIGRDDEVSKVMDWLLNSTEDVSYLTIVGMGGLGKTALVKHVFGDDRIKSEFPVRLWVCVADQEGTGIDVNVILLKMLKSAGCDDIGHSSTTEYLFDQYEYNLKEKKFLLVLDDIWTESHLEWVELRKLLMMGGKGSRIIATTRSTLTACIIGNDTLELEALSVEDSWRLFKIFAFRGGSVPFNFQEIAKKIVEKCSGVPLAIKVTGAFLYGASIDQWERLDVQYKLYNTNMYYMMDILKFSYDDLEPSVKCCFAYCAIFPKDYVIKKELLISLWDAQGYTVPLFEGQTIEDTGEEYLSILLQRYFLEVAQVNEYGEVVKLKLQGLMHDLAQRVSGKEFCILNSRKFGAEYNCVSRHLFDNCVIEDDFVTQRKFRSYLMFRKNGFDESPAFPLAKIAKSWGCLRVMALQGLCVRNLPDTMGNLLHLRYLNLAKNSMKKLPDSIAKLYNLQTLNLNKCDELKEWPREFSKLVNLTHLYRAHCYELRCMPVGMSKLTRLRVLTDFVVEDESANGMQHVGQLKDLKALAMNLKGRLLLQFYVNFTSSKTYDWGGSCLEGSEHLKEVDIHFSFPSPVFYQRRMDEEKGINEEQVMQKLQPHSNLLKFNLSGYAGEKIAKWGRVEDKLDNWATFLPNLVHIKLSDCHRLQQLPILSKLLHLKSLYLCELKNLKYMEEEVASSSGSGDDIFFPSLESLEIHVLKNLKAWWRSSDSNERDTRPSFPHLSHLTIENCPQLVSFPPCITLPKLDLRNNNEALRITTAYEVHASSSFQRIQPAV